MPSDQDASGRSFGELEIAFLTDAVESRTGLKKELFGYVPGGYARILEAMGAA